MDSDIHKKYDKFLSLVCPLCYSLFLEVTIFEPTIIVVLLESIELPLVSFAFIRNCIYSIKIARFFDQIEMENIGSKLIQPKYIV